MFSAAVESDGLIYWPKNVPDPPRYAVDACVCLGIKAARLRSTMGVNATLAPEFLNAQSLGSGIEPLSAATCQ